ncbi:MAG: phenylalanine--tRNA ligase subunit alpha [Leptolyngbyaceae cyanobacterium T60_A2020_046]|nr:phenylalanine--tRNA ligase subunit alpha [Leptolyngbyaceae cyanobacterium T60_A2020_046]
MLDLTQLSGKQRHFLQILQHTSQVPSLRSLCEQHGFDFNFIKGFVLSGVLDDYITLTAQTETTWALTPKGLALNGEIPGAALADRLIAGSTDLNTLQADLGDRFSLNVGALRKTNAIALNRQGSNTEIVVLNPAELAAYAQRQDCFAAIAAGIEPQNRAIELTWLQTQGYIAPQITQDYRLTPQPALHTLHIAPIVTALTSELILSGQWQQVTLKPYDIHAEVPDVPYGRPTLLTQCIQHIRDIFLNMGFDEMAGFIVESAFWNFDVLFTPQDHPAREEQDTFYLAQPQTLPLPDDPHLVQQVKHVHETHYSGQWTEAEAQRAILRAHTTPSTARRLYQLQGKDAKYFSIDKVFRNETVDRTHLAEFHQIEGVVVGELLSVRTLMGYLTYFYERLGFKDLKFQPTYNPYTEPSLEVYAYHPPSQRYLEVGNSGLFRQEMLAPLGCGDKSTVAWGLGLERIAMLLYGVEKLSDLVGPEIRLQPTRL